jgi:hypothetical protein
MRYFGFQAFAGEKTGLADVVCRRVDGALIKRKGGLLITLLIT